MTSLKTSYVSTTNACKLCKPLGACVVFRGVEGAVPFLHGSQGCATYMRRYLISHFREPVDIASSSLGEKHAIYGGGPNLKQGLRNVIAKYGPKVVGVATNAQLLKALQWVERSMGRERVERWGPRVIDIDILLFGQEIVNTETLVVPHPEMHRRRFVLEPMNEIAAYVIHPLFGVSMKGLLDRLEDDHAVERIGADW